MSTFQRLLKEANLDPQLCPKCGQKHKNTEVIEMLFALILNAVKNGEKVAVPKFGIFSARTTKGGIVKSDILPGGEAKFPDTTGLKFKQSLAAREHLNPHLKKKEASSVAKPKAAKAATAAPKAPAKPAPKAAPVAAKAPEKPKASPVVKVTTTSAKPVSAKPATPAKKEGEIAPKATKPAAKPTKAPLKPSSKKGAEASAAE
jgi:nucleoid DNA-binding protein